MTSTSTRTAVVAPPPPDYSVSPAGQRIRPATAAQPAGGHWRAYLPRAGQIVTTQVALAALLAALGRGVPALPAAALLAGMLLTLAWGRVRQRWLHQWLGIALGYLARRRPTAPAPRPSALLALVAPDTVVHSIELAGASAAVFEDPDGMVALLEIGDPADLLGDGVRQLPSCASLLPATTGQTPPVRVQLLLSVTAAPAISAGGGPAANSYRQLTDGRLAGRERAVLAVRVLRTEGWSPEALRRALAGTVRRIVRRLGRLPVRPLGEQPALRVLAEFAHHDGRPVRESWQTIRSGGLLQTTFRLRRWPTPEVAPQLLTRLSTLPVTATTVSLHAETGRPMSTGLSVRLGAPTAAELSAAAQALRRFVAAGGGAVQRLDGAHRSGFADTLPLARPVPVPAGAGGDLPLPYGSAGLMLGVNRHGRAVTIRLFRPESTRVMVVGGIRAAQLLTLRALALGCRVVVQTTRPLAWEPFVRGAGAPGGVIPLVTPGRPVEAEPGTPLSPVLVVSDAPPPTGGPRPGAAWQATLLVRDELTPADTDALARADLAVLQPLNHAEALIAGAALGLGESAELLTRIRYDMVAVVNRRALRWALLAGTPIEAQLIGPPART
ncbi:type VII secretion protein EccE [Micromonospora radicis]|uniref:Type VII secretion protein EccE n=1 Tax=Micromonospora radicis TaxID=1894971 RepID=A0A418MQV0_9ACTN|nr:type VII secretion protein EccE [Micromonospora radicis]RIV36181.1 type VII secretion protein EccE [Micromonospora radicis]